MYSWLTFPSLCSTWTCDLQQDHPHTKQVASSKQEEWSLSSIRSSVYSVCSFFIYFLLNTTLFSWLSLYMFVSEYSIISFFCIHTSITKTIFFFASVNLLKSKFDAWLNPSTRFTHYLSFFFLYGIPYLYPFTLLDGFPSHACLLPRFTLVCWKLYANEIKQ